MTAAGSTNMHDSTKGHRGTAIAAPAERSRRSPSSSWGVGPWPVQADTSPQRHAAPSLFHRVRLLPNSFRRAASFGSSRRVRRLLPYLFRRARLRRLIVCPPVGRVGMRPSWLESLRRAGVQRWISRPRVSGRGRRPSQAGLFRKSER